MGGARVGAARQWAWSFGGGAEPGGRRRLAELGPLARARRLRKGGAGRPARVGGSQLRPGLLYVCSGNVEACASCLTTFCHSDLQFSYHNFDRSRHDDDDIRGCAVLDLASLQWVAMQCETQLDWICKIPRGWVGWCWETGKGVKGGGVGNPGEGLLSLQRLCPCCRRRHRRAGARCQPTR